LPQFEAVKETAVSYLRFLGAHRVLSLASLVNSTFGAIALSIVLVAAWMFPQSTVSYSVGSYGFDAQSTAYAQILQSYVLVSTHVQRVLEDTNSIESAIRDANNDPRGLFSGITIDLIQMTEMSNAYRLMLQTTEQQTLISDRDHRASTIDVGAFQENSRQGASNLTAAPGGSTSPTDAGDAFTAAADPNVSQGMSGTIAPTVVQQSATQIAPTAHRGNAFALAAGPNVLLGMFGTKASSVVQLPATQVAATGGELWSMTAVRADRSIASDRMETSPVTVSTGANQTC
jgi:hypothetical protein